MVVAGEGQRAWWVYLLACADGSYYVGISTDVERRLRQHNAGRGARYTRARRPVALAAAVACEGRSEAMRLEARLKQLNHRAKARYFSSQSPSSA
jgi:putative endonuclease